MACHSIAESSEPLQHSGDLSIWYPFHVLSFQLVHPVLCQDPQESIDKSLSDTHSIAISTATHPSTHNEQLTAQSE